MTTPIDGPYRLWGSDRKKLIPHEQVRSALVEWFIDGYRPEWDQKSPDFGREYFRARDAGLKAYAAYEADFYLRALFLNNQKVRREFPDEWHYDQFGECMFLESLNRHGKAALADEDFSWLINSKCKMEDDAFFIRLGGWLQKDRTERSPNIRIKQYAWGYDRLYTPWEYCPDSLVAQLMFYAGKKNRDFNGDENAVDRKNVEKWRSKYLGLKTSKPFAAKWNNSTLGVEIIKEGYSAHRIPMTDGLRQLRQ